MKLTTGLVLAASLVAFSGVASADKGKEIYDTKCFTCHAAGVAASLCSSGKRMPREIDVKQVQAILTADGVDLSKGGEDQDRKMAN